MISFISGSVFKELGPTDSQPLSPTNLHLDYLVTTPDLLMTH